MSLGMNFPTGAYEAESQARRYVGLYDRLSAVLPAEPLAELAKAVTLPDVDTLHEQHVTRLTDACETGDGYATKDLTTAAREITTIRSTNDAARNLADAVTWEATRRVRATWPAARPATLAAMSDALSARSDQLHELAALIPSDFTDAHAFHARDEMQQAWRDLAAVAELVTLAVDVDSTGVDRRAYGFRDVATVIQIVEDPIAHGGTSVDLDLSRIGMYTLPNDRYQRLRELGARGARLTFRPHADAVAWLDQHYHDLPTSDQRAALIRELDQRWRNAA